MLVPVTDTIDALSAEITGLLSAPANPALAPEIFVHAARARLAGVGGYVGLHDAPVAEIHARVLEAQVAIRVLADTEAEISGAAAQATRDVIAADPALLRQRGLLRIEHVSDTAPRILQAADGVAAPFARDLLFSVRYEHRPLPTATEGALGSVGTDVTLAALSGTGRLLYETEFLTDPLADFDAITGAGTGTPGNWSFDAPAQELTQSGTRGGGANVLSGNKTGTYLVLRPSVAGGGISNFVLRAEMRCDGTGGIGLVFRYQDADNFAFVLLEEPGARRIIGKRQSGTGAFLETGGQDATQGRATGEWLRLRLLADADRFELSLNERIVLTGQDSTLTTPGAVGLFCRRAGQARFRHFRISSL